MVNLRLVRHRTAIFLSDAEKAYLKSIGDNEISGGVRTLIKWHNNTQKITQLRGGHNKKQ